MVFFYLAEELRCGDVAVTGSEEYADWSEQLLPWEQVEAKLPEYLVEVGLCEAGEATAFDGRALVAHLRRRLAEAAAKADGEYPDNDELFIDPETGVPKLKPCRAEKPRASAHELSVTARRHTTTAKLNEALTDVGNAHAKLDMSRAWGNGTTAAAADTQGQSYPVFALAHLLGIDLMPRIRNWKDCLFFRPSRSVTYEHIDALFGEPGRNVIDWHLIETHYRDLMRVTVSVREGAISSTLLLKRLRSGSKKNATYTAFREVGRVIRTVQLLRFLSDAPLRGRVTAATNKVEAFNGFSDWVRFGQRGTVAHNDPVEQEKDVKFTSLLANLLIFHDTLDIAEVVRQLQAEGEVIDPLDLAQVSPYLTEHVNRFGVYSAHELGIAPEDYDTRLDVDFSALEDGHAPVA